MRVSEIRGVPYWGPYYKGLGSRVSDLGFPTLGAPYWGPYFSGNPTVGGGGGGRRILDFRKPP